jgi:hypothetical protein
MVTALVGKLLVWALAGGLGAIQDSAAKTVVASKRGLIDFMVIFSGWENGFLRGQTGLAAVPATVTGHEFLDMPQLSAT